VLPVAVREICDKTQKAEVQENLGLSRRLPWRIPVGLGSGALTYRPARAIINKPQGLAMAAEVGGSAAEAGREC
jgi:hypothetical protein